MRVYGWRPFGSGAKSTTLSWRALSWPSAKGDGGFEGLAAERQLVIWPAGVVGGRDVSRSMSRRADVPLR